jgi:hypothetical protein
LGIYVGVGKAGTTSGGVVGVSSMDCGLGMSTTAMKGGVGVDGRAGLDAQLEINTAQRIETR